MSKLDRLKAGELKIKTRKGDTKIIKGKLVEEHGELFFYIKAKKIYLSNRSPFKEIDNLTDKKICSHCGKEIVVGDYKILIRKDEDDLNDLIACPNAPECDGFIIDWFDSTKKNKLFFDIETKKPV